MESKKARGNFAIFCVDGEEGRSENNVKFEETRSQQRPPTSFGIFPSSRADTERNPQMSCSSSSSTSAPSLSAPKFGLPNLQRAIGNRNNTSWKREEAQGQKHCVTIGNG
jgi:hypothetical protein